jgi:hypothetical protein
MNTKKELASIVLLMASITTVIISPIDLVGPKNGYVHAWLSGGNIDDKGEIENLDAGISYYDKIHQSFENPYEDGWD